MKSQQLANQLSSACAAGCSSHTWILHIALQAFSVAVSSVLHAPHCSGHQGHNLIQFKLHCITDTCGPEVLIIVVVICITLQDTLLPRLLIGTQSPTLGDPAESPKPAAAGSPSWLGSAAARAASAGLAYPSSPTAAVAPAFRNSISAASPSQNINASMGFSSAAATAAHAIATAAAASAARELEDRVALAEGRAVAAERAALEAARAAETASRRVASVTADLARASADVADARGRFDAVVSMNQQVRVGSRSVEL